MNSRRASERLARQLSSVRQKKISKIRERIASGKYVVTNIDIAKALFMSQ